MGIISAPGRYYRIFREDGLRAVVKHWVRFPRKLVPTKAGWIFFAFMLAIVLFAFSTNNNLLFLLFSAMMSLMLVSGLLSEASLGKISLERSFPTEIYAKRPFVINHHFTNSARIVSAFAFYLEDSFLFLKYPAPMVIYLAKGSQKQVAARATINNRGRHILPEYKLVTEYPFLLFTKSRRMRAGEELLVFPEIRQLELDFELLMGAGQSGTRESEEEGDNFAYLREYEKGEPLRKIDWKKSARQDDLYIKEFVAPKTRKVTVVFNKQDSRYYETGLSVAASIIVFLNRKAVPFRLFAGDKTLKGFGHGHDRLIEALSILALYQGEKTEYFTYRERTIEVFADGSYEVR